ncbi:MAG: HEAT repeat domain-containing protein [Planctomycetota bacterium]|jgi:tetratricopeptide (TPR) repeat protein
MTLLRPLAVIAALGAIALPGPASAQEGKRVATEEGPADLVTLLGSRYQAERYRALERLVALGESAVPELLRAIDEPGWSTRLGAYRALGRIGSKAAVAPLTKRLHTIAGEARGGTWHDPAPAYEVCLALTRIRPEGYRLVESAASGEIAALTPLQSVAEHALVEGCRAPIMKFFAEADENGSYKDRFQELRVHGRAGVLLLLRIARQLINGRPEYRQNARMAIQALGDGDDPSIRTALERLHAHLKTQGEIPEDAETDLAWALHRHGGSKLIDQMIAERKARISPRNGMPSADALGSLARLCLKIERFAEASDYYVKQAKASTDGWGVAYYNAACAHSMDGKARSALAALRKAVEGPPRRRLWTRRSLGDSYDDVEWMQEDGDLTFARKQGGFWYLVAMICGRHRLGTHQPNYDAAPELMKYLRKAAAMGYTVEYQNDYDEFFAAMQDAPPSDQEGFVPPETRKLRREFETLWRKMGGRQRR